MKKVLQNQNRLYLCGNKNGKNMKNTSKKGMYEIIQTTPEIAKDIIERGGVVVNGDMENIEWININNMTCFVRRNKNSGYMADIESVELFIKRASNRKTVF